MIEGLSPPTQALYGTLFTWFVTALGAAVVFVQPLLQLPKDTEQKFLDVMLGFAAGVMMAASYWSLLAPAIEWAEKDWYGSYNVFDGVIPGTSMRKQINLAWMPASVGFAVGALFVLTGDNLIQSMTERADAAEAGEAKKRDGGGGGGGSRPPRGNSAAQSLELQAVQSESWRRTLLLVFAITLHNIPEGMAVGVGFGALGNKEMCDKLDTCKFESAFNLALGIGIQNFPEGLAVSMPLYRAGIGASEAFFYGQMSGMVEPIAGYVGAVLVLQVSPIMPYALAFAAGAMIFVVVDDLIPEAHLHGNGRAASVGAILGFVVMMGLDVSLG